jgi:hypothetical protein
MEEEIKKPELTKPKFFDEPYDYRNIENVGHFDGVGEPGKVGKKTTSSMDAMPPNPNRRYVPRDHRG